MRIDTSAEAKAMGLDVPMLEGRTIREVRQLLDGKNAALLVSGEPIPPGWPKEILREEADGRGCDFFIQLPSGDWQRINGIQHSGEVQKLPAIRLGFIYTRKPVNASAALVRPVVKMLIHRDDTCHHVSAAQVEQMMRPPTDDGRMPPGSAAVERLARGLGRESPRITHEVRDFTIDDRWRQRARFGFRYPDAGFNLNDAVGARRFEMRVESDRSVTFRMGDDETTSIAVAADASGQRIALVHESGIDAGFIDVFGGPLALEVEDRGQARRVKALFLAGNGPDAGEVAGPDGVTLILVVEEPAPPVVERSESSPGRPALRWKNGVLTLCAAQGTPLLETRASNESGRTARYIFADIDVGALVPKS